MRILWHWFAMGPYHFARMAAVARQANIQLTVVETTSSDDHHWSREGSALPFELITLSAKPLSHQVHAETGSAFGQTLERIRPEVIVASGYAEPHSRAAVLAYKDAHPETLLLFWSESTAADNPRNAFTEGVKRRVIAAFDGALVAGTLHRQYLVDLGMRPEYIRLVGGCVDNAFFSSRADAIRERKDAGARPVPAPYFLYVGRFIPVKNLAFLLRAYHFYRVMSPVLAHDLVLVGSGPEEANLRALIAELHLDGVHLAGVKQAEELPAYYAHASCLVLPSWSEPWGLVANEAMASGIPVVASSVCGCAGDLIVNGSTGYLFDRSRPEELALRLQDIASNPDRAAALGAAARQRVSGFTVDQFGRATVEHILAMKDSANRAHPSSLAVRALTAVERFAR